ncbi:MAG: anti-sigma factor [Akkermansiaceae bacterium]|nr:anti-sigma factor [Akkermansiaceae bacterium]
MISDLQEEQACFYVLGLLPENEVQAFEAEIRQSAELSELVASLNNATLSLARSAPPVELPAEAKRRLLEAVSRSQDRIVPFERPRRFAFLPWGIAACLAAILYSQWNAAERDRTNHQSSLLNRDAELKNTQDRLREAEASFATTQQQLNERLATAELARNELLARVASLEQKDFIAQAKIAVMSSKLKDRPQAVAVSLWDQEKQSGLLVVENLPVLDAGKDYQLWVIDPSVAAPVSAGVFKVDATGKVRVIFKPNQQTPTAATFAVTEENEGGVQSPTMDKMVVIGGV